MSVMQSLKMITVMARKNRVPTIFVAAIAVLKSNGPRTNSALKNHAVFPESSLSK